MRFLPGLPAVSPAVAVAASLLTLSACFAVAQTPAPVNAATREAKATAAVDAVIRRSANRHYPGSVAVSPDGAMLAYTQRAQEGTELHVVPMPAAGAKIDTAKDKLVTPSDATNCSNTDPAWSPDSKTLAYTSTCTSKQEKPGQEQIFLFNTADGTSRELTHVVGNISSPAWSPNGRTLAFLFVQNATRNAGALDAMKPLVGVIGKDTFEVQGVYGVEVANGRAGWLVPATDSSYVYEFDWSPNSREIAYVGAHAPGENNWWVANLYVLRDAKICEAATCDVAARTVNVFDPATTTTALKGLQIAVPRFSPDGRQIAFIGGLMSDQGSTGGDIWVADAKPNAVPVDVTPQIDGTPTWLYWLNDKTIGFVEDHRGHMLLAETDAKTAHVDTAATDDLGEVSVFGGPIKNALSVTRNGHVAFIQYGPNNPPEIWAGNPQTAGSVRAITDFSAGAPMPATHIESVEWENEGFHVQGWLTYPKDYDPAKKYGIIVQVHGGPTASVGPQPGRWAQLGYFELEPNPRGSMGQGEAFVQANVKDFGYGDLRDILKGLDTVEAKIPAIDHTREGITGWSYGGFMTMFAVTQTHRFRAAVAGAGISDWLSYYGENSIDQWMIPFFGASVYDDPAVYAKSSPITFIKQVTTPTLVIVGDRDGECPAPQSFEFWHALRDLGVKTELVVYPDEGHGFRNPEHIKDRAEREARWFAEYLK